MSVSTFLMRFTEGNAMHTSIVTKSNVRYSDEYEANGEDVFVLEVQRHGGGGWVCIDATRPYGTIGQLVNYSPIPNVKGKVVNGKLRLGFMACKDIKRGDEVLVDYGR